jgi:hypothetical protein
LGEGNDNFPAHELTFDISVRIVFAGIIVAILPVRCIGNERFEEFL